MSTDGDAAGSFRFGVVGVGLLATVGLVWGMAYVFIREGILYGATPFAFASARYVLAAMSFVLLALVRREPWPSRRNLLISAGIGGTLFIGLYGGLLYWGEQYTTGGYAAVLASTLPLLTVAVGFPLLASERLGGRGLLGMAVGFGGTALLVLPELLGSPIGSWQGPVYVLSAMATAAVATVLLRRVGGGRQGLWQIATQFGTGGLLLGAAALVLPTPESLPLTAGVVVMLVVLVVASSVIGYFAYFALHHRVGPVRANIVAYLTPLVGVGVGSGFFGEAITAWELGGVGVVLVGVTLVLWESARRSSVPPNAPTRAEPATTPVEAK